MCEHLASGLFEPEVIDEAHDHPVGFADGDVIWKRYPQQIVRCPVCHEYQDTQIPESEDENE